MSFIWKQKGRRLHLPKRVASGTVDFLIGKLRSIFSAAGRGGDDSSLPGYGNPAASKLVKLGVFSGS